MVIYSNTQWNYKVSIIQTLNSSVFVRKLFCFFDTGYLAIYSNPDSLRFIKECLKQIEDYESQMHTALPLIVLLANEAGTPESEIHYLRNEGHNLANK